MAKRLNRVRIIGGKWKGTRINIVPRSLIRPTSDRAKTTLFNWLHPVLSDMRVLDLFAGTGALGFEALSRGARQATFVERDMRVAANLRRMCDALRIDGAQATVVQGDALRWLGQQDATWDLVFLDPPYDRPDLSDKALRLSRRQLRCNGLIYVETSKREPIRFGDLEVWKHGIVGEIEMALLKQPKDVPPDR